MGEIEMVLDQPESGKRRTPEGVTPLSPFEIDSYAQAYQSQTLREKLAKARRG